MANLFLTKKAFRIGFFDGELSLKSLHFPEIRFEINVFQAGKEFSL